MPSPGDKPRPWLIALWPFLWLYLAVVSAMEGDLDPEAQEEPEPPYDGPPWMWRHYCDE